MNYDRIDELRQRSEEFDEFCREKTLWKRIKQAAIFSVMEGTAIGLPTYVFMTSEAPLIKIGTALYGLTIGMLGVYYPKLVSEMVDEQIFEEAEKLEQILDEEH